MGKRKCSVYTCLSETDRPEDVGVTFHKIPPHPDTRPKWIELCKINEDRKTYFVCSRHFLRADFCNFKGKKYMLRQGVLPSIFPWNKTEVLAKKAAASATSSDSQGESKEEKQKSKKQQRKRKMSDQDTSNKKSNTKPPRKKYKKLSNSGKVGKTEAAESEENHEVKSEKPVQDDQDDKEQSVIEEEDDLNNEDVDLPPPILESMVIADSELSKGELDTIPLLEPSNLQDDKLPVSKKVKDEVTEVHAGTKEHLAEEENSKIMEKDGEKATKEGEKTTEDKETKEMEDSVKETNTIETEEAQAAPDEYLNVETKPQPIKSASKLSFEPSSQIEVFDGTQIWASATILEVDYEENEVLVHFDNLKKCDEWIGINSANIRAPLTEEEKKLQEEKMRLQREQEEKERRNEEEQLKIVKFDSFNVNERCMAYWFDTNRKFPATVLEVHEDNTYTVKFDDGYIITVKADKMTKSSMFASTNNTESKEERRNKKRKLNVSTLFKTVKQTTGTAGGGTKKKIRSNSNKSLSRVPSPTHDESSADDFTANISTEDDIRANVSPIWYPSFADGYPVGTKSKLPSTEGFKDTVKVVDPRLPLKWEKHLSLKPNTKSSWYSIIVSADGKKFRYRADIQKYLSDHPEYLGYTFDFSVRAPRRKLPFSHYKTEPKQQEVVESSKDVDEEPPSASTLASTSLGAKEKPEPLLKILQVDGGFQCPIDGCGKKFRKENLAQMHVKHYHPKYSKFLDSTPNVLDLVYARMHLENPEMHSPNSRSRQSTSASTSNQPDLEVDVEKDQEIKRLLNSTNLSCEESTSSADGREVETIASYAERTTTTIENNEFNIVTTKSGIKTIPPVVRSKENAAIDNKKPAPATTAPVLEANDDEEEPEEEEEEEEEEATLEDASILEEEGNPLAGQESQYHIIEGGEVIKIVRMKQEEIINCTCGITEEDGLMIQCELCMCWQHAHCNNIFRETDVPDKYICYICQHPFGQRSSAKYVHDQEWLKRGVLPTAAAYHWTDQEALKERTEKLRTSHDISGGLLELKDFARTLQLKIKIAQAENHPKLYLWSKAWDKSKLPENRCHNVKEEEEIKNERDEESGSEADEVKGGSGVARERSGVPEPEVAIETEICRLNLLEHIAHYQSLVEERLDYFEKQILDLNSSSITNCHETDDEEDANVRLTTTLLLKDLSTLKEMSQVALF